MSTHKPTSKRRQGVRLTPQQKKAAKEVYLRTFKNTGNIRASCLAAGIDRSTVREWEEHDPIFCLESQMAGKDVDDLIEAELFRRAMHGDKEPVVSMGKVVRDDEGEVMTVTKRSDAILMFIAKARMPKYREKQQIEHSGSVVLKTEWGGGVVEEEDGEEQQKPLSPPPDTPI